MSAIRRPDRSHPILLLALLLLLLAACTTDDGGDPPVEETAASVPSPTPPVPSPPPAGDERSEPDDSTQPCGEPLLATLVITVDGQLDAIVAGDWTTALGFASIQFREGTDVAGFEQVIEQDFPVVADAASRDIGACRVGDDQASLGVVVEDGDGNQQSLLYLFQHDPGGWAIAGAVPATPGGPEGDGTDRDTITALAS